MATAGPGDGSGPSDAMPFVCTLSDLSMLAARVTLGRTSSACGAIVIDVRKKDGQESVCCEMDFNEERKAYNVSKFFEGGSESYVIKQQQTEALIAMSIGVEWIGVERVAVFSECDSMRGNVNPDFAAPERRKCLASRPTGTGRRKRTRDPNATISIALININTMPVYQYRVLMLEFLYDSSYCTRVNSPF